MTKLLIGSALFKQAKFGGEPELERVVVKNSKLIFGDKTVYFDVKKRVSSPKGDILSIPDGYVLNFQESRPRLWIIENEISTHDAFKDIGVQLWKFANSFRQGSRKVKNFLLEEIKNNNEINKKVSELMKESRFPNFSELLDFVVFDQEYGFIVVIDERTEDLDFVFKQLAKQPEVIEIKKYVNTSNPNEVVFRFSEFQEEIKEAITKQVKNISDVDTIVCPANEEGFKSVFLDENRWYAIRMSPSIISQIKYIAMYETAPVSAIRWIGFVQDIRPYKDTGKYEVVLSERKKLDKPLKLSKDEGKKGIAPRGPRYTKMEFIQKARKLSDIF